MTKVILFLITLSTLFITALAEARCWSSSPIEYKSGTTTPDDSLVQKIFLRELKTAPVQYELIFQDEIDRARTIVICPQETKSPGYCGIEDDGGGFYFETLDKRVVTLKTTGRPVISVYDDGSMTPAFSRGQEITFKLRQVRDSLCQ